MLKRRSGYLRLLVLLVLFALAGRLVWVQGVKAAEITARSAAIRLVSEQLQPPRGAIMDRAGRYLAVTVVTQTVVANTLQMPPSDYAKVADGLAKVLKIDPAEILKTLQSNPEKGFIPLKTGLTLAQAQAVKELKLSGIALVDDHKRTYPQGNTANQVIGYLGADGHGEYGLEAQYDKALAGSPGSVTAEFTDGNTPIESTIQSQVQLKPGENLVLTLDASLQQEAEQKLAQVVKDYDAHRALAIAMDIHTGEILMMAMAPGANPGDRSTWGNPIDWNRVNNWAISDTLSPGSIFKAITSSIALEEHDIDLNTVFIDNGRLVIDGRVITNWDGGPPKPLPSTIAELLQRSSNVGLMQVGERIPHDQWIKYMQAFGLMEKTGVDLPGEGTAIGLDHFDQKKDIDWNDMYIGQHLQVTPLQVITAETAIYNGGYLVQPHLVRQIQDDDGNVVWTAPAKNKRQVISSQTAEEVRKLLVSVVEKGTATSAQVPGYIVGGKTGTAQKFQNGVMKERMLADFLGFAPASNPQIAILVMVDEPKGNGYGGEVAAPVVRALLPDIMRSLGIPPDDPSKLKPETAPPQTLVGVVPDVRWMPLSWAKDRLTAAGFQGSTSGQGDVVGTQSPEAGTARSDGSVVQLGLIPRDSATGSVHVPNFSGLSLAEASKLSDELGLMLRTGGSGFVSGQDPNPGTVVPAHSSISVRLAPR